MAIRADALRFCRRDVPDRQVPFAFAPVVEQGILSNEWVVMGQRMNGCSQEDNREDT